MDSILDKIFEGDLYPNENTVPSNPEYRALSKKVSDEMENFQKELSTENYSRLEEMIGNVHATSALEVKQAFCNGAALGLKIMNEVYGKDEK